MLSFLLLFLSLFLSKKTHNAFCHADQTPLPPTSNTNNPTLIPDSYIVVLKSHVHHSKHKLWLSSVIKEHTPFLLSTSNTTDGETLPPKNSIRHVYTSQDNERGFKGYSGQFEEDVLEKIRNNEEVDYIEQDQMVYVSAPFTAAQIPLMAPQIPFKTGAKPIPSTTATKLQRNAPWNLARISHRMIGLGSFNKYPHDPRGGEGVTVYVIDTGVNIEHVDFEGRARWGITIPLGEKDTDGNGHGTHCSGTIGGKRFGVAKKAQIVAVKAMRSDGSGTMSDIIKAVDYVIEQHRRDMASALSRGEKHRGTVANLSLGGGRSRILDRAVNAAVREGINFAVAAGNDNDDACNYSPAAAALAMTVAASTITDVKAFFSNWGRCVDIFAPGQDIISTWIGSPIANNTISGTSMASPHIAGVMAYKLSLFKEDERVPTPKELKELLLHRATKNVLYGVRRGTPNLLVYSGPETEEKSI